MLPTEKSFWTLTIWHSSSRTHYMLDTIHLLRHQSSHPRLQKSCFSKTVYSDKLLELWDRLDPFPLYILHVSFRILSGYLADDSCNANLMLAFLIQSPFVYSPANLISTTSIWLSCLLASTVSNAGVAGFVHFNSSDILVFQLKYPAYYSTTKMMNLYSKTL